MYSILTGVIYLFSGISSYVGGVIADSRASRDPSIPMKICIAGQMIAIPCYLGSVFFQNSFYVSISFTALRYLLGEVIWAPSITMIQITTDPNKFPIYYATYQFFSFISGCTATLLLG
jgi:hypothetical protein